MKILIDGMNLALEQGTGVATYAKNLSYCIKQNGHHLSVLYGKPIKPYRDRLLREAVFFDNYKDKLHPLEFPFAAVGSLKSHDAADIRRTGKVLTDHISGRLVDADELFNIRHLFHMANLRSRITGGVMDVKMPFDVDIAHWTYPIPARIVGAKNIYTIHDMVPIKLPYATLDSKYRHYRILKTLAKTADHLVTVSDSARADIIDMLKVDEGFVTNTYQSVQIPAALTSESESQRMIDLRALNITVDYGPQPGGGPQSGQLRTGEFYLYVGAIEPKKNLKRTIEAYLSSGVTHPLLVVGRKGWKFKEEMKMIERARNIHYLDYVPFNQLITLIQSARALVFASLYEGFGLPILEAFMCGTPVITAAASSTQEIAGDAAVLVNPYSVTEIRDAFRRLSADQSGELRAGMSAAGRAQAELFSQDRAAERLQAMYDAVLSG